MTCWRDGRIIASYRALVRGGKFEALRDCKLRTSGADIRSRGLLCCVKISRFRIDSSHGINPKMFLKGRLFCASPLDGSRGIPFSLFSCQCWSIRCFVPLFTRSAISLLHVCDDEGTSIACGCPRQRSSHTQAHTHIPNFAQVLVSVAVTLRL